jgi:hypothetical protein
MAAVARVMAVRGVGVRVELGDAIVDEAGEAFTVVVIRAALECAEADMAFRKAHQNTAACGGGLVIARELLAGFDKAEGLGCVHAERFKIGRREDLAHAPL